MSFVFPFEYAQVAGLGRLFYPIITASLKTVEGWREFEFLVDTGADITTVPTHLLPILGLSAAKLSENTTFGVGGFSIKTLEFRISLRIGTKELFIRCNAVDSKEDSMPLLLGRKDVFEEKFSLSIDSKHKQTIISAN